MTGKEIENWEELSTVGSFCTAMMDNWLWSLLRSLVCFRTDNGFIAGCDPSWILLFMFVQVIDNFFPFVFSLHVCLYLCLSLCLSVCLSLCLWLCLSLCLSLSLSFCLSVSVSLSVSLSLSVSVSLFLSLSVPSFAEATLCGWRGVEVKELALSTHSLPPKSL